MSTSQGGFFPDFIRPKKITQQSWQFPNLGFCFWILLFFLFRHLKSFGTLWGSENYLLNKPYLLVDFKHQPLDDVRWYTNSKTDVYTVWLYIDKSQYVYIYKLYIGQHSQARNVQRTPIHRQYMYISYIYIYTRVCMNTIHIWLYIYMCIQHVY